MDEHENKLNMIIRKILNCVNIVISQLYIVVGFIKLAVKNMDYY